MIIYKTSFSPVVSGTKTFSKKSINLIYLFGFIEFGQDGGTINRTNYQQNDIFPNNEYQNKIVNFQSIHFEYEYRWMDVGMYLCG
jgi:hypothetical protein